MKTQEGKQNSTPVIEVELAISISVEIPAPEGYEDMSEEELTTYADENKDIHQEYQDALNTLAMTASYHRETYPKSKIEFTPMIGEIEPREIPWQ